MSTNRSLPIAVLTSAPGSGLGLATVRQIVVGHGGSVIAENVPACGARVGFVLPVVAPAQLD